MIIGFIWYHQRVFGTAWMRMAGIAPSETSAVGKATAISVGVGFIAAVIMAYVFSHMGIAWGIIDAVGALELAFWLWLGFIAPTMIGIVLWEQKPVKLFLISAGYWLVSLMVMSLIILYV